MPKKLLPLAVLLAACGQKGPLYLPQDPAAPAQPQPAAVAPGTAAASAKEEEIPARTDDAIDTQVEPAAKK